MSATAVTETPTQRTKPPRMLHAFCMICHSPVALCGFDLGRPPRTRTDADLRGRDRCVVCIDLISEPCPTCGAKP